MKNIAVHTNPEYCASVGGGLLSSAGSMLRPVLPEAERIVLVTDDNVALLWADLLEAGLHEAGWCPARFVLPQGENAKTTEQYVALLSFLAEEELTRTDAVIALGGGALCDLAGFAAATYLRGIPFVTVPTTLLSMTDAAVGGKTGINLPAGKNLAGAFAQPAAVICDTDTLSTLPAAEFTEGCAEVLKYAVLGSRPLFDSLRFTGRRFHREPVVAECIEMKAGFVTGDERDRGSRRFLNLGHTVGHAVEARSGYSVGHGSAVAMGMAVVTKAAAERGICDGGDAAAILAVMNTLGLPVSAPYSLDELVPYLRHDKKRSGSRYGLVLPESVGRCRIEAMREEDMIEFLKAGF